MIKKGNRIMKTLRTTMIAALLAATLGACGSMAFADTSATPAPAAKASDSKLAPIPDVKYPYTFVCAHCGIKITVNAKEDWTKPCAVCPCCVTNQACLPKPAKKK